MHRRSKPYTFEIVLQIQYVVPKFFNHVADMHFRFIEIKASYNAR